jgi:sulfate adenylyltransferase subunit 1 (EFTu-like GTPase family)
MDRVGWSRDAFRSIEAQFHELVKDLGFEDIVSIPVAAKSGDNIVARSHHMQWYRGPTLLEYLERAEPNRTAHLGPFRMPIQLVSRPGPDFRGYSGMIASGEVRVGMPVRILPSGQISSIARIVTFDGDLGGASAGRSVTLTFTNEVDASRGDLVAGEAQLPVVADRIRARVFWMKDRPLKRGQNYLFKLATSTATAGIEPGLNAIDLDTRRSVAVASIAQNEVGTCALRLDRPIALDRYADCKDTGSFILIDPETYDTVGMGCIEDVEASRR